MREAVGVLHSLGLRQVPPVKVRPPKTKAETHKIETIQKHLSLKRASMAKTMQQVTMLKVGPGTYQKELNLIGKLRPSNSVKGFGNGFVSKADRGLVEGSLPGSFELRSLSQPRLLAKPSTGKVLNVSQKCPPIPPRTGKTLTQQDLSTQLRRV